MAIFFSAATAAGAFGGLLARGILEMRGVAGLAGWRWLFILEGILTFVIGECDDPVYRPCVVLYQAHNSALAIAALFIMKDYPATTKFLTEPERTEVLARLKRDRSSLADEFDMKYFWAAIGDWKIWVHMFITIGIYTCLYSFSLFLPTIVSSLGYKDPKLAQLMTVPPYVVACFFCVTAGWLADKMQTRGLFMIVFQLIAYVYNPDPPGTSVSVHILTRRT